MIYPESLRSQSARQTDFILDAMKSCWKSLSMKASCDFKIPQAAIQRRTGKFLRPCRPVKRLLCLSKAWIRVAAVISLTMALRYPSDSESRLVMSNSLGHHGLWPDRLFCPWNSPGKNTRVGCHALLQGIFLTEGSNSGLPQCRFPYCLSHQGSPRILECIAYPFSRRSS